MKVVLVNGSPHQYGCTYTALMEASKTFQEEGIETELFWIGNDPIAGCRGCRACAKLGKCVIDDVVNRFQEVARTADGFLFGTPVHYAAASGAMTSFMDRVFYTNVRAETGAFQLKPAACVISARRAGTTAAFDQMNKYFTLMEMPVISSCYWNMVHGARPEDVLQDEEGLRTMRVLARNMAFFLKCKETGLANGVELPKQEPIVRTNFIR